MKIPLLVFMSEIKIDLTLKKSNFLFLLCFKIAKIKFILMRQPSQQRYSFFSSHFTLNLMLPACLLGMILKNSLKLLFAKEISRKDKVHEGTKSALLQKLMKFSKIVCVCLR